MPPLTALSKGTTYTGNVVNPGYVEQVPSTYGTLGSLARWRDRLMDTRVMPTTGFDPHNPLFNECGPAAWHDRVVDNMADVVEEQAIPGGPVVFVPAGPAQSNANAALNKKLI